VKGLSRRGFLILGGAAGVTGAAAAVRQLRQPGADSHPVGPAATPASTTVFSPPTARADAGSGARPPHRWSDPGSWSHGVPGPDQVAVITRPVTLDVDARVAGVVVQPRGQLVFDPEASHRLESSGNVIVLGRLLMRPATPAVGHRLVFTGVREAGFAGGGMDPVPSDVGLWVMDRGTLDLAGAPRLAWTRVTGAVDAGATAIELQADPEGWQPGDELVLTPSLSPTRRGNDAAFDTVTIRAIEGRGVTLMRPVRFAHPTIDLGAGPGDARTLAAEVLNLTRNVGIEGTSGGRSHVFIRSSRAQSIRSAAIRHMGPRKQARSDARGPVTELVLGRYGLHFHMCDNGSRGSVVEDVVIRDAGSHSFVAHQSHGVSFRGCLAYDVMEDAYWWDGPPGTETGGRRDPGTISDDIVYDRCVAALVRAEPDYEGYTLTGFQLGRGSGNICRDCLAVGVQGNVNASGFSWGENQEGPGIWRFHDNVAHNNRRHGIFWWQVTTRHHTVLDFVAYRNGGSGILNGSYGDNTHFERCLLVENGESQFFAWAESAQQDPTDPNSVGQPTPQHLVDSVIDSRGLTDFACVLTGRAIVPSDSVGRVTGNVFRGARKACVAITFEFHDFGPYPANWLLSGNVYQGNRYWFDGSSHEGTAVETESGRLRRADRPGGRYNRAWNAKVG
jgi:hypothetical protein